MPVTSNSEPPGSGSHHGNFQTTIWSEVYRARDGDDDDVHHALGELCAKYWYPIYSYVRRRGYSFHDAQDLTQGYFSRLLERGYLRTVDNLKGRFRSFLLTSLKWYLAHEWEKAKAAKRGDGARPFSLDEERAEDRFQAEWSQDETSEFGFDRQFARAVFERSLARLKDELDEDRFRQLSRHILEDHERSYAETAAALGMTESGVKSAVRRMRQRCGECFREEISETVAIADEIDDEVRYLLSLLG